MRAEKTTTKHRAATAHQPGAGFQRMRGIAMVRPLGEFCLLLNRAMRLPDSPSCNDLVVCEFLPVRSFFGVPKRFLCRIRNPRNTVPSLSWQSSVVSCETLCENAPK